MHLLVSNSFWSHHICLGRRTSEEQPASLSQSRVGSDELH